MLTQESRENMGRQILKSCRQLVLSKYNSETCVEKLQMTAAMIDRIIHHGYLLIFEGRSYRVEHALMRE